MLQSRCLRLNTGALWYVSNRQIHEDLGVPSLAVSSLIEKQFDFDKIYFEHKFVSGHVSL